MCRKNRLAAIGGEFTMISFLLLSNEIFGPAVPRPQQDFHTCNGRRNGDLRGDLQGESHRGLSDRIVESPPDLKDLITRIPHRTPPNPFTTAFGPALLKNSTGTFLLRKPEGPEKNHFGRRGGGNAASSKDCGSSFPCRGDEWTFCAVLLCGIRRSASKAESWARDGVPDCISSVAAG
jgi:hypothetical protein